MAEQRLTTMRQQTHCLRGHERIPENLRSNGRSVCCVICAKDTDKARRVRQRTEDPFGFALDQVRRNAKRRGIEWAITRSDFPELPTHCPVFGIPLDYSGSGLPNAASIDRRDNNIGYVPGNVVIMSRRANHLKNDATVMELQLLLDYLKR